MKISSLSFKLFLLLYVVLPFSLVGQELAITLDGDTVVLGTDGKWTKYVPTSPSFEEQLMRDAQRLDSDHLEGNGLSVAEETVSERDTPYAAQPDGANTSENPLLTRTDNSMPGEIVGHMDEFFEEPVEPEPVMEAEPLSLEAEMQERTVEEALPEPTKPGIPAPDGSLEDWESLATKEEGVSDLQDMEGLGNPEELEDQLSPVKKDPKNFEIIEQEMDLLSVESALLQEPEYFEKEEQIYAAPPTEPLEDEDELMEEEELLADEELLLVPEPTTQAESEEEPIALEALMMEEMEEEGEISFFEEEEVMPVAAEEVSTIQEETPAMETEASIYPEEAEPAPQSETSLIAEEAPIAEAETSVDTEEAAPTEILTSTE
ncbi:MAG: hypothetical protein AAFR61_08480 [Bacteroidota bacterium]